MRVIVYLRQSKDREGNELAIERQRAECLRLCRARGWTVADTIPENNKSASRAGRPGFGQVVEQLRSRKVDGVVVLRIDRLFRLNDELETLINLVEHHGGLVATVEGDIDLSTPSGRLVARVLVSVARAEMEVKSARHKSANKQRAEAGLPHSAKRPYGYERDQMTIRPAEADVLRRMGDMVLAGHGFKRIAWWANENGHLTSGGRQWTGLAIRLILTKPRYGGIRLYDGVEYKGAWTPVFDRPTWDRLQYELARRRTGKKGDGTPAVTKKYLLTAIARCGNCGMYLSGHQRRDERRNGQKGPMMPRYVCRAQGDKQQQHGCGGIRRSAIPLDHMVKRAIIFRLDTPELGELLRPDDEPGDEMTKLLEARADQQRRKSGLVKDYATGLLDASELAQAKLEAQTALDAIDAQIAELGRSSRVSGLVSPGQTVAEAWDANDLTWRRNLVNLLIKDIIVNQGKTKPPYSVDGVTYLFDPGLVQIKWRKF